MCSENGSAGKARKRSRVWAFGAAVVCMLASAAARQDRPRFSAEAFANLFELRVLGPDGNFVPGLNQNDFRVVGPDGAELPLVFFQAETAAPVCVALLVDTGSSMSSPDISTAKEFVFRLIHLLDREDEILLATYDDEIHFLSPLTSQRGLLVEGVWNIAPGARPSKWSRLGNLFVSTSATGYAIDHALLKMKKSRYSDKIVVVLSAGFGNIGEATDDHLHTASARLFGVSFDSKLMDVFNMGGDQMARKRILRDTGGVAWAGKAILERVESVRDAIKRYYLLAYQTPSDVEKPEELEVEFQVRSHPEYRVFAGRRTKSTSSFY